MARSRVLPDHGGRARHLDDCPDCRQDLDVLQRMKCSLRRLARNRPTDLTAARLRRWARRLGS